MLKHILLPLMLLSCLTLSAQRTCGKDHIMEQIMSNPASAKDYIKRQAKFKLNFDEALQKSAACANVTTLPMAIHYQGINNPDVACLTTLAVDQVRVLNEDYQATNADIVNWTNNAAASFPGISNGETCIEFCIATQSHPTGYGLSNGDLAITFNQFNGDNNNDWSGYINIFVRNINFLGYSPLGGSGNGDGVTIDDQAFGLQSLGCGNVTAGSPYTLGRTLTHELGHYLNLDHMWGNGGCNSDDGVTDTPNSTEEYYGCPNIGASSCNSTDMHMSYMDYVDDPCMYMFSAGQSARMESYVANNLQNVANNAATVCNTTPPTPTCSDGIQNQGEAGVDCGGPCPACETCTDGIQNQDETGVDCGGSICSACPCLDNSVTLTITLDDYPEETSWEIADANGNAVFSGGTYDTVADGTTLSGQLCLPDGCYDFTIFDEFGDGICCGFGNGSYSLVNDASGATLASGGQFASSEITNFCLSSTPPPTCNTDPCIGDIETLDANTNTCVVVTPQVFGCTVSSACNYNPSANCDDGSCSLAPTCNTDPCISDIEIIDPNNPCDCIVDEIQVLGCTDATADNFDANANCDNGSCSYGPNCDPFLNLSDNYSSGVYTEQAINYITSNSTITGTADMTYHAGDYVEMTAGFEVTTGANFHGYILACSANTLPLVSDDTATNKLWIGIEKSANDNSALVQFNLPTETSINISILAIDGTEVFSLAGNEILKPGAHEVLLEKLPLKDGVYYCKLKTQNEEKMVKLILSK